MNATTSFRVSVFALVCSAAAIACSASSENGGFEPSGTGGGSSGSGGDLNISTGSGNSGNSGPLTEEPPCPSQDADPSNTDDVDMDGETAADGDCNDCTWQMNRGAYDFIGNNIDEDCNGAPDDTPVECDGTIPLDSADPFQGAAAMGLCKQSDGLSWGVVGGAYVRSDGTPLTQPELAIGRGILNAFGPNVFPQEGVKLLALSSGTARQPSDPGYATVGGTWKDFNPHGPPPGYPKESPSCPGIVTGEPYDSAGLQIEIKTPTNAKSLAFNLNFYTYEFPGYICSEFNDFFVALLTPTLSGQPDGNISFDSQGNTISVNAGFLEVCYPQMAGGKNFPCMLGPTELMGTGYDEQPNGSAATGWLQTTAPVEAPGGTISLLFTTWDSGDGILDSTVLLDNFTFHVEEAPTETIPVPEPK